MPWWGAASLKRDHSNGLLECSKVKGTCIQMIIYYIPNVMK